LADDRVAEGLVDDLGQALRLLRERCQLVSHSVPLVTQLTKLRCMTDDIRNMAYATTIRGCHFTQGGRWRPAGRMRAWEGTGSSGILRAARWGERCTW